MGHSVHQNCVESRVQQHFGHIRGRWIIPKNRSHIRADEPKEVCHDTALSLPVLLGVGEVAGALLAALSAAGALLAALSAAVLALAVDSLLVLLPPLCAR
jgi:hypothetical protein